MENSGKNDKKKTYHYERVDLRELYEKQKRAELLREKSLDDLEKAVLERLTLEAAIAIRNNDSYQGFSHPYDHLSLIEHQKLFIDECNRTLKVFKKLLEMQ